MKISVAKTVLVGMLAVVPSAAGLAQTFSCPGGATPIVIPGQPTPLCPPIVTNNAPEVSSQAGVGGLALMLSGAMMLRGRKRKVLQS